MDISKDPTYKLVSFDTAGTKVHDYVYRNSAGQSLGFRYSVFYYGEDKDLGTKGVPGVKEIAIQGQFLTLFDYYKRWIEPKADMEAVKADGSTPWKIEGKIWSRFFRVDGKGVWQILSKQQ